jgi:hypothetical protein
MSLRRFRFMEKNWIVGVPFSTNRLNTNGVLVLDTIPLVGPNRFYRAVPLP